MIIKPYRRLVDFRLMGWANGTARRRLARLFKRQAVAQYANEFSRFS
jgi:hypothetical protein